MSGSVVGSWRCPTEIQPLALTVPQAVKASGNSRSALYLAMKSGDLVARKNGKRTLILIEDLNSYLQSLPIKS